MRTELKRATAAVHARLDAHVGGLPLGNTADYSAFLTAQFGARSAIEPALAKHPLPDLAPMPSQLASLAADLSEMGYRATSATPQTRFANASQSLGAAWVVSGSSMGNRAILVQRNKAGCIGPERFLSDTQMANYFRQLVAVLENAPAHIELAEAVLGAKKAFAVFEAAFTRHELEAAA
ncbi:biliverdin-producing heme oxygenase [Qipengyuania aurantiaca]|uniref:Biliverdin-producing heme oxygenase n=1 Tax=Qipengyuania aurantiaca TaxID=2867233 RepID=A0ABX8ZJC4_9SPHN|nr:biliverdin-producing heme oxygenase [Qipengyuania aurantiaca]QZD88831.1 biliverdin-producing heme oxygenase [Qipengyuania aurantiaca]